MPDNASEERARAARDLKIYEEAEAMKFRALEGLESEQRVLWLLQEVVRANHLVSPPELSRLASTAQEQLTVGVQKSLARSSRESAKSPQS